MNGAKQRGWSLRRGNNIKWKHDRSTLASTLGMLGSHPIVKSSIFVYLEHRFVPKLEVEVLIQILDKT